ncbi:MAG: glycerol-3-phosphate 1-O-acyltransferase PlsY [Gammaproteobacteria bacterium]|nr:glycerol-3-phosphate 1-O-acyltransferase PlsY [Gammaproteobacteria bacterium]NIR82749.1 glycerol-3-phosphate 1-O-acyltransferase PlsY [Gammaproteobacteria bacterium]NIR89613.1 glycerol-3-phosphate 1-O-acyltransferase PlsY [Gammaproteobacteria bacterium]NIU03909.1 glycerol-3-phosphate 1-O-acyltransferase PlsY [Gammaproteobacteria bacterium]NIV51225.1 glycerol-3-phosphate 1-O-acyltransferase PlsY [Gammaproteobacteria bacterium]
MWLGIALVLAGYLIGSVASAVVVCRVLGLPDPRGAGSHNPGATNVLRLGGKKAAAITLAADVIKGALPVLAGKLLLVAPGALAATALAAFLGHLYPVFFGFKGGKGVATGLGAVLALAWPVGLAMAVTWLAVAAVTRYSSLSALTAAALSPVYALLMAPVPAYIAAVCAMALILVWTHRDNIQRLLAGTETKIGAKR